jgi:glyoxylate/hydroxypyruvate reductase A
VTTRIIFYEQHTDAALWLHDLARALPEAELREWQPGDTAPADYAVVWRAPRELFANRPDLKAVFNLGAGVDAILDVERKEPGTLRYLRRFDEYEALQREGRWEKLRAHPRESFTVGVLGLGVLGAEVARALSALGVPVRGFSRGAKQIEGVSTYAGATQFDAFLDGVKVLINLLPHTPDTEGILNRDAFAKLAHGAYLVNLARGAHLIDEDLLAALDSGQIAAATLDVFHTEPLPKDHPFWRAPRVTVTPHVSAETLREESVEQIARKITALERGEPIGGIVDVARGY